MSDNTTNEANKHFRHYTFTKIESEGDASIKNCNETNVITSRRFQHFKRWLRDNLLLIATICGVIFSLFLGFILRPLKLSSDAVILISYPGELFTRLLKLFILPLIIASLIAGSAKLNVSLNGKIAFRTLIYFVLTSLTNAILGTILVLLIHPGNPHKKLDLGEESVNRHTHILDGLMDLGRNMFPDNLFQAAFQQAHTVYIPKNLVVDSVTGNNTSMPMDANVESIRMIQYRSGTNTLGIIFFCLIFGTILGTMGRKANIVVEFFTIIEEVVMRMVSGVMWLTPVGIISVICGKILSVGDLGLVLQQVGWFIFTVALGVFLYQFVIMQLIYFIIVRRNPYKYYWGLIQATLTAFATASTAAALPVTFRCMDQKVGVDPRISRFILPIGCNINMDGTAMFVAISSFFIAQMNEMQLSTGEIITVCLVSTAASFSSASVPSAALALIFMVLSTIDAPTQEVSLLFAIDWFVKYKWQHQTDTTQKCSVMLPASPRKHKM
ncbi:excitatory amino acid transporter-like isoform X3 [Zootermopsis nevadensis]|uniref:excitatory amino acid transporter-like isoform X3 n=1 Tax=Zootermopsis nevadensis TaxID=136037 RepID=UPI000B8E6DAA|nr:excitatory amino acid transporter-like isoform X3 [Zootermopsis nevadensis]